MSEELVTVTYTVTDPDNGHKYTAGDRITKAAAERIAKAENRQKPGDTEVKPSENRSKE